jgi:hypothetical protein
LAHIYDTKALKKAFDAVHIKEMTSFKYNLVTDQVEDTIAESAYAMMKDDTITGTQSFMEFDLSAMSLEESTERPQASILGKMYSGQDSISTQHHAGQSRAPQSTSEDILEITPDELQELQNAMLLHTQTKNKTSARKNTLHIANLDTNTMLQQIRARRAKIAVTQQDDDMDDNSSDDNSDSIHQTTDNVTGNEDDSIGSNTHSNKPDYTTARVEYVNNDNQDQNLDESDDSIEQNPQEDTRNKHFEIQYHEDHNQDNDRTDGWSESPIEDFDIHMEEGQDNEEDDYHDTNEHQYKDDTEKETKFHREIIAIDQTQISQSATVGNDPPSQVREGGRG